MAEATAEAAAEATAKATPAATAEVTAKATAEAMAKATVSGLRNGGCAHWGAAVVGGDDRGRRGQRLSMIAPTGGGGGGWGRATEAAAGEGMSSGDVCFFVLSALRLLPLVLKPFQKYIPFLG